MFNVQFNTQSILSLFENVTGLLKNIFSFLNGKLLLFKFALILLRLFDINKKGIFVSL